MLHSMCFFWNRYELPAVAHGLVSIDHPRMGIVVGGGTTSSNIMESNNTPTVPFMPQDLNQQQQQQHGGSGNRVLLPPRNPSFGRGQSHPSMNSLGRNSSMASTRPPSSTGLPFHGDDDGDGSESYMYFMNGEVSLWCD